MKKNMYYNLYPQPVVTGILRSAIGELLFTIPKFILDVFLRRNMGERYFTRSSVIVAGLFLWFFPVAMIRINPDLAYDNFYYAFMIAFGVVSVIRYREVKREPSVFDFAKYSLTRGIPHQFFYRIRIGKFTPTRRSIDLFYEPVFCFLIGLLITLLHEPLTGLVIIICAGGHFILNNEAARAGDNFIMDKIDQIIVNQDMSETFVQGKDISPRQTPFFTKKPTTEALRQALVNTMMDDDDDDAAIAV